MSGAGVAKGSGDKNSSFSAVFVHKPLNYTKNIVIVIPNRLTKGKSHKYHGPGAIDHAKHGMRRRTKLNILFMLGVFLIIYRRFDTKADERLRNRGKPLILAFF